jgi:hypothetical protein
MKILKINDRNIEVDDFAIKKQEIHYSLEIQASSSQQLWADMTYLFECENIVLDSQQYKVLNASWYKSEFNDFMYDITIKLEKIVTLTTHLKLEDFRQLQETTPSLRQNLCRITNKNNLELDDAFAKGEIKETILLHHAVTKN